MVEPLDQQSVELLQDQAGAPDLVGAPAPVHLFTWPLAVGVGNPT